MGLFNIFKHNNTGDNQQQNLQSQTPIQPQAPIQQQGLLNLQKNDILDLSKGLSKVRVAAGWDVNHSHGHDYDLDLCAFTMNEQNNVQDCVYYGHKNGRGLFLDGDNRTGEGEGDDEHIYVNLDDINSSISKIIFSVVIYQANKYNQKFGQVKNAYVRLIDTGNSYENEICRYNLSEDGDNNTAVVFASLNRTAGGWQFQAIGDYTKASISQLKSKLAGRY